MALIDLNDQIISQVRQSADIVEFISQVTPLKAAGKSYKGLCPFHREKSPSFQVDRDKGLFYCFGCGVGGDVFKFLTLAERYTFPEAVEHVAGRLGIELPKKKRGVREADKDDLHELLDDASEAYHQALEWHPNAADDYLRSRQVKREIVTKYGFGFAPDSWDYLITRLARKHGEKKLESVGLAMPRKTGNGYYDRFRNRLMIPIHSETGSLVGFGGRSLDGSDPKYLNSPESELFNKSKLLYNLHRTKDSMRRLDRAILVEGYFDAIALDFAGVPGVVASMGTSLTIEQAKLIRRFARRVVIAYDGDNAGRAATLRAAQVLFAAGVHPEVLDLGGEKDPDALIEHRGTDVFYDLLAHARDIFDFALQAAGDGLHALSGREKSERLEKDILPLLGAVADPVIRNDAAQRISDAFGLEFETVWSRLRGRAGASPASREPERRSAASEYTAEKMILTAALQGKVAPELAGRLREEFFADPLCRSIFSIIKTDVWDGHPIDFAGIATHLRGEAELTLLSELTLSEELDDRTLQRLDENLRPMEQGYCDRRQQQIQREINDALRAGDEARADALFAEKIELSRMLKTLK